jgi:copper oxidase (laccase) domain-containing protein
MGETVHVVEVEPKVKTFEDLDVQAAPLLPDGFSSVYARRNPFMAPQLSPRFDGRAQAVYRGLNVQPAIFPLGEWEKYQAYPEDELAAIQRCLKTHRELSVESARAALNLRNINWLGLANKGDVVQIGQEREASTRQDNSASEHGYVRRFPLFDVGAVGPRDDNNKSITLAMAVADSLAIPIIDKRTGAFALAHAGRSSTGLRSSEKAVHALADNFSSNREDLVAHLGEGACVECYNVDGDEIHAFIRDFGGQSAIDDVMAQYPNALKIVEGGDERRYAIDLHAFNKYLLTRQRIGGISVAVNCTIRASERCVSLSGVVPEEDKQLFFSHRRTKGQKVGWLTESKEVIELNTAHLGTPRNLAAVTRQAAGV